MIVIDNGRADVAPWGELATLSCMNRKVEGVVIDGAVRDVDEIRKFNYPVFARAIVPNAGEPKGYGRSAWRLRVAGRLCEMAITTLAMTSVSL